MATAVATPQYNLGQEKVTIRVYSVDSYESDTEKELSTESFSNDREENTTATARMVQNKDYIDEKSKGWRLEPHPTEMVGADPVITVRAPTASFLDHNCLNPSLYRHLRPLDSFDNFAAIIGAPLDWETTYNESVATSLEVQFVLHLYGTLPHTAHENEVSARFVDLVKAVATSLKIICLNGSQTKIGGGGFMARPQYNVRSTTDVNFSNSSRECMLSTEMKTERSFFDGELWYHASRGVQTFASLFRFNAPTILATQSKWKLFCENRDRSTIFTYPCNHTDGVPDHINAAVMEDVGSGLIKAITISLLACPGEPLSFPTFQTPNNKALKIFDPKFFKSHEKAENRNQTTTLILSRPKILARKT